MILIRKNLFSTPSLRFPLFLIGASLALSAFANAQAPGAAAPAAAVPSATAAPGTAGQGANNNSQTNNTQTNNRDSIEGPELRKEVPAGSQDARTEFQQMVEATTGRRLPNFGDFLFTGVPSTFAPVNNFPVGPGYILGPGDEINGQISGAVNQTLRLVIDRSGNVELPGIGVVHLAGVAFGDLESVLNQQLGKLYRNYTLSVNLGTLRSIQVFVVGQARRPGTYTISSLSTLTNAIFASGGPSPQGSMRDIQVKRGGVTIDHFDVYDLLLKGDKTKDIALATGDVIFIPEVGPQIAVVGSVNTSAIFELKGPTPVREAITLAGGFTPVAVTSILRLERVDEHLDRSIRDVSLDASSGELLRSGDIISVTSVIDRFKNAVTLRGNVANPGRYVWHQGMRISDLLPNKEALITRNYWRKRNQLGQIPVDYTPENTPNQTEGALQLRGNDTDRNAADVANKGTASNAGGNSVGAALTQNNSSFSAKNDVILSAPDIYWDYAVIERLDPQNLTTSLIPFNLGSIVLNGKSDQNYELLPGDSITIFSKSDLNVPTSQQTRYVRLEGEFNAVGEYSVLPGETLRGLVRRVGGFTPDAYLYASEFTRESTRRVEQQRLNEYADELAAQISAVTASNQARAVSANDQIAAGASEADARTAVNRLRNLQPVGRIVLDLKPESAGIEAVPDIALEDGDRFVVPRVPANINVEGQVYNANAFLFQPHERVLNYLERAGGPDRQADRKRIFVIRADGSVVSRQYADVPKLQIFPGDTIVVPPTIDKRAALQRIVEVAQAVAGFGLGAATIYLLAR